MMGAAAVLAAALFAFLGDRLIAAYGDARYQAGLAAGQMQQVPAILAANAAVTKAGLEARDHILAADAANATRMARLAGLVRRSDDEVRGYEQTEDGRADCLSAERVRTIEANRAALFPVDAPAASGSGKTRSLPAEPADKTDGRDNE